MEVLKDGLGPIDGSLGDLEGALGKVRGAMDKLVPSVATLGSETGLIQQTPEAPAVVGALEAAARRLNAGLDSAEAALGSLDVDSVALIADLASLAGSIDALATAAGSGTDLATLSAGVDGLDPAVAGLESRFGSLGSTGAGLVPTAEAIEADAVLLETTVGELCSLVSTTCP